MDDNISQHIVVDTFWRVWMENGEPHKHGFYESTWMAIRAALDAGGVKIVERLDKQP
jgi:hypothetical protein